ncbi:MAG: hemolysin III family protein [Clostridiaceae bacterium]
MEKHIREPINGFTHLFGAIASLLGLIFMLAKVILTGSSAISIVSIVIFGVSMILLYSASATYHMVVASDKVISFLRKLDHSMIFVLIAGSYTPFCLIALNGTKGWILFSIIIAIAILGILFKMIWFNCPRWLSTLIYIFMGWIAVFTIVPLYSAISLNGVLLLVLGGVLYTTGGLIYGIKPKLLKFKYLGFHEIFHVFILLGTLAHYFCILKYVI